MKSYFPPVPQVAALLIAAVTALTLGLRAAEATPCKGAGATCPTNRSCCSGLCLGAKSGGRNHVTGVCAVAQGGPCTGDGECASGRCVDGVCCDAACDGTGEACTKANTGADNGTCEFVSAGLDPNEQCPTGTCLTGSCDGAGACGKVPVGDDPNGDCPPGQCVTGSCDGAGACGVLADTTHCNDGMFCSQTDHCDGAGHCVGGSNNGCPMNC